MGRIWRVSNHIKDDSFFSNFQPVNREGDRLHLPPNGVRDILCDLILGQLYHAGESVYYRPFFVASRHRVTFFFLCTIALR
jgi:hypothetical protein